MAETQGELHNRLAGPIVASIVKPVLESGGTPTDVMVLLESVVMGVFLACVRLGGDKIVLDTLVAGVRTRIAEKRLTNIPTKGSA